MPLLLSNPIAYSRTFVNGSWNKHMIIQPFCTAKCDSLEYLLNRLSFAHLTDCWHNLGTHSCNTVVPMVRWWTCSYCTWSMTCGVIWAISKQMARILLLILRTINQWPLLGKWIAGTATGDLSTLLILELTQSVCRRGTWVLSESCIFWTSKTRWLQTV